jgi:hypothetical protein
MVILLLRQPLTHDAWLLMPNLFPFKRLGRNNIYAYAPGNKDQNLFVYIH